MELILVAPDGDGGRRRYVLADGETLIGRRQGCRIVLDAPSISPRHARLFCVDGRTVMYGHDDAWPVYVNGEPVKRRVLADGDQIELGPYRMRFVDAAAAARSDADPPMPDPSMDAAQQLRTSKAVHAATDISLTPAADDNDRVPDVAKTPDAAHDDGEDTTPLAFDAATPTITTPEVPLTGDGHPQPDSGEREPAGDRAAPAAAHGYHLDILTGINQGRRVTLTRDLVVLGFNRQRLVEIRNQAGTLLLRRVDDQAVAHLNGLPISDEPAEAGPGDVVSLQRIDLRIHHG